MAGMMTVCLMAWAARHAEDAALVIDGNSLRAAPPTRESDASQPREPLGTALLRYRKVRPDSGEPRGKPLGQHNPTYT